MAVGARALWERLPAVAAGAAMAESAPASIIAATSLDEFVKSLFGRHPGEPRIMSRAGAGVQKILN